jgi:hypothetical protein
MKTEASRLFDELNRRYWKGRLPRYRVIRRQILPRRRLGICSDKTGTILLLQSLAGEELRLTLLHEMCHIGSGAGYSHGPRFQKKMRRLVRLGEVKLLEDVERYDGTDDERLVAAARSAGISESEMSFRDAVQSDLEAIAFERPGITWATIRWHLAETYKMSPSAVERAVPGAVREWRRLSSEARSERAAAKAILEGRIPTAARRFLRRT